MDKQCNTLLTPRCSDRTRPSSPSRRANYLIQAKRVTDAEAFIQMSIPNHETCVHVTKSAVVTLPARDLIQRALTELQQT